MIKEIIKEFVVAELSGKYWGVEYEDGHSRSSYGFTDDITNAKFYDAKYYYDITQLMHDDDTFEKLKYARLRKVTVTTFYEY